MAVPFASALSPLSTRSSRHGAPGALATPADRTEMVRADHDRRPNVQGVLAGLPAVPQPPFAPRKRLLSHRPDGLPGDASPDDATDEPAGCHRGECGRHAAGDVPPGLGPVAVLDEA